MSKTAIINSGRNFFIKQLSENKAITLDQVIFANISGVTGNTAVNLSGAMPTASQIVHKAAVTQAGLINDSTVVYSVILDTTVGDFSFNYIGLVNSATNTLCVVMHTDSVKKMKTAGQQQGNTITESIWLEMDNASTSTGVTVNAQTWQIDFSNRLAGEDERIRLTNLDLYGRFGIDSGFVITKATNYTISSGVAYVAGLRINHTANKTISASNGQSIYIDAWLEGTPTGQWDVKYNILAGTTVKDYVSNGFQHYCEKIATIDSSGNLTVIKGKGIVNSVNGSSGDITLTPSTINAVSKIGDTMTGDLTIKKNGATVFLSNASNNGMAIRAEPSGNVSFNSSTNGSLELKMHYDKTSNRFVFSNLSDVTINNKSVLKQSDHGLGAYGDSGLSCSIINNIDTYSLTNGFYPTAATTAGVFPSGLSEYGTLIVNMRSTSAYKSGSQLYIDSARGRAAFRTCHNNNDYNEWKEIVTTENINNYGLPVGIPQPWPTVTPPAGWLKCNGATFDKTLYPKLAIAYPSGKLPDLRGEFIRGFDDGRGIDTGRTILSNQGDAIRNIKGTFQDYRNSSANSTSGVFSTSNNQETRGGAGNGTFTGILEFDASRVVPTANENRPQNVAFLYIVKAE